MAERIKPYVGMAALVKARPAAVDAQQAEAAIVTFVHSDTSVNLTGFNASGVPFALVNVQLVQGDDKAPEHGGWWAIPGAKA